MMRSGRSISKRRARSSAASRRRVRWQPSIWPRSATGISPEVLAMEAAITPDPYPARLRTLTRDAVMGLLDRLKRNAPVLGGHADIWVRALAGDAPPERYFVHPRAFPAVLLPWRAEEAIHGRPSRAFE